MPDTVHIEHARTPNPRSMKFTADGHRFAGGGLFSFGSPADAVGNTLAEALFAVRGVTNVLILPEFVTVTLDSPQAWPAALPAINGLLSEFAEPATRS